MGRPSRSGLISYWKELTFRRIPKVSFCSADSSHQWSVPSDDNDESSKSRDSKCNMFRNAIYHESREGRFADLRMLAREL